MKKIRHLFTLLMAMVMIVLFPTNVWADDDPRLSVLTLTEGITATFVNNDTHPWVVTTAGESLNRKTIPGTYVPGLRSNIVDIHSATSTTTITLTAQKNFMVSFKAFCESEDIDGDYMQVFVDGSTNAVCKIGGNSDNKQYTFSQAMTAGTHTFRFYYCKDSNGSVGYDTGFFYDFKAVFPCNSHTWGEWIETLAPTCTNKGVHERTCSVCGITESGPIEALGHVTATVPAKEAGLCDNPGHSAYYKCSRCNVTFADAAATHPAIPNVLITDHAGPIDNGICSKCGLTAYVAPLSADGYYELSIAKDLRWFAEFANKEDYRTANGRLMNDIDAACTVDNQWIPIGSSAMYLGFFDGNGKKINGIYYDGDNFDRGFIADLGDSNYPGVGSVKDLTIDGYIKSTGNNIGGIVGHSYSGSITGCTNLATIIGKDFVGGIVGLFEGPNNAESGYITGCINTGTVTGTGRYIGGIAGLCSNNVIVRNSYNTGAVTSTTTNSSPFIGGAFGYFSHNAILENVYSTATISLPNTNPLNNYGGLIGCCGGNTYRFTNCFYDKEFTSMPFCVSLSGTIDPASVYGGKSTAQFASGELAWSFNGNNDTNPVWYQAIGVDASPTFKQNPYTIVHYNSTEGYYNTPENFASLTIADGTVYNALLRRSADELTYTRNISESQKDNWQALYVPFAIPVSSLNTDFDVASIQNFHEYADENGNIQNLTLEVRYVRSGTLKANHPYLVRPKSVGEKNIVINNALLARSENTSIVCQSVERRYTFTGTYQPMRNLFTSDYLFMTGGSLLKAADDETELKAQRWYLAIENLGSQVENVPVPVLAKGINISVIGDDATGIEDIKVVKTPVGGTNAIGVYDLQGRSLLGISRGLNIVRQSDGKVKKIMVK